MIDYPYHAPIILNDSIFTQYGGETGTSTPAQRTAAYQIAEIQASQFIGTFLLPTIVTGTFSWPLGTDHLVLPYSYVHAIKGITVLDQKSLTSCEFEETAGYGFIWSDTYGYIDPRRILGVCPCAYNLPYQIRVAWESGLPTGTANQPTTLLALSMAADIALKDMVDPSGNEGAWDIGVTEFTNQDYREKRVPFIRNAFGSSARAQAIAKYLRPLRRLRALQL